LTTWHKARLGVITVAALTALAMMAGPADAVSCKAPPGMSAIDEYCEAIPAPGGDRGNTDPDRGGVAIPAAALRALDRAGPAGKAIVALSGPASKERSNSSKSSTQPVQAVVAPNRPSQDPFTALGSSLGNAGDTAGGPLLGTVLLLFALVFFASAWLRYRRRVQS
jgi:hypothetical protein